MVPHSRRHPSSLPLPRELLLDLLGWLHLLAADAPGSPQLAWTVLLSACLRRSSLEAVARQTPGGPCATAVREVVQMLLGWLPLSRWEDRFNEALRARWLPLLQGQRVTLVGDETGLPFWGRRQGLTAELRGGAPKNGACRFFYYVTIAALWRGIRVPLGVARWRAGETLGEVFERLAGPLLESEMVVESWLWDRGAATVGMLRRWQAWEQPFVVAAPRKGPKHGVASILTRLEGEHGFTRRQPPAYRQPYTLHPEKQSGEQPVTVTLVVGWERVKRAVGERRQRSLRRSKVRPGQVWRAVAWFTDAGDWRGRGGAVQAYYRKRQSIESSYRLSHAYRGRTSSRDVRLRFLLFALSQLVQSLWSWQRRQLGRWVRTDRERRRVEHWRMNDYAAAVVQEAASWLARPPGEGWPLERLGEAGGAV